ncbi:MAG: hypothetical protein SCARUB_01838 [Candidatus Scalindua rubra]|uniref:Porin n=1 Tax=Candidatus Scalindua rubra TaxID=1872076 RepID=A0A1E3XBN8_9BACT|nr:MAG: hypothetical protein SCARUB_01838 [Candidatus Scalindua rubra]
MDKIKFYLWLPIFAVLAFGSVSFAQGIDREALKAELRQELKAELKQELMQEVKAEILKEAKISAQKATQEAKVNFKEEIRSEIMEETKVDLSTQVSKILEESPLLSPFKGVTLSGFVDTNYFYNLRLHGDEGSRENALSPLNFIGENENNSLTLESFTLFLDKQVTDENPVGWQMHTYFGEKAKRITFLGEQSTAASGDATGTNDVDRNDVFTVSAANVSWKAPVAGKDITFTFGKLYTWIGLELVENTGNPNYQHGILYNNAIPFTHTGISADVSSFLPSDKLTLKLYGVNGWDSFIDNNSSKSIGWYISYEPTDKFFISLAGIHGAEGWDNEDAGAGLTRGAGIPGDVGRRDSNNGLTQMFDVVATWQTPHAPLTLMFNFDWGTAEDAALEDVDKDGDALDGTDTILNSTAHWWGVAAYALYDFTDWFQGVVRYEYFDDTDGVRFFDQSIWETTITTNIKMRENLWFRPEYRHNEYSTGFATAFDKAAGGDGRRDTDSEDIIGIGIEYVF